MGGVVVKDPQLVRGDLDVFEFYREGLRFGRSFAPKLVRLRQNPGGTSIGWLRALIAN
jgi:hypothetical protein